MDKMEILVEKKGVGETVWVNIDEWCTDFGCEVMTVRDWLLTVCDIRNRIEDGELVLYGDYSGLCMKKAMRM